MDEPGLPYSCGGSDGPTTGGGSDLNDTKILLLGLMGSGKTSVGRALAAHTGWPYADNDDRLAAATGQSLGAYAEANGRQALHDLEAQVAADLLAEPPPFVAGVAASVGERPELLERIRVTGFGVYLRARVDTLLARIGADPDRPWLRPDPRGFLTRARNAREPGFLLGARLVVDVDDLDPPSVARAVLERLSRVGGL